MKKNILIVSNFFYPELTPRAFRVHELTKEFTKLGHKVTLVLPNKEIYKLEGVLIQGLNIVYSDSKEKKNKRKKDDNKQYSKKVNFLKYLKNIIKFFFPKELFQTYDKGMTKCLKSIKAEYDILISVSHPISIHTSVILAILCNSKVRNIKYKYAEFSDPLFSGSYTKIFPLYHLIGFLYSWIFNFFSIPTKNSLPYFTNFKTSNKIKIIPQGFDFSQIKTKIYSKNNLITFAYAGSFYENLRNPNFFFDYLNDKVFDFRFIIYTQTEFVANMISSEFPLLRDKIILKRYIPREELIYELSSVDFLINFDNENSHMVPSKLIDYALCKRPILSFNSVTFNSEEFVSFIKRDFKDTVQIDLENFNVSNIAKLFLDD